MHQTTIAKMEAARRPTSLAELEALAHVFGVSVASLVDVTDDDGIQKERLRLAREQQIARQALRDALDRVKAQRAELDRITKQLTAVEDRARRRELHREDERLRDEVQREIDEHAADWFAEMDHDDERGR